MEFLVSKSFADTVECIRVRSLMCGWISYETMGTIASVSQSLSSARRIDCGPYHFDVFVRLIAFILSALSSLSLLLLWSVVGLSCLACHLSTGFTLCLSLSLCVSIFSYSNQRFIFAMMNEISLSPSPTLQPQPPEALVASLSSSSWLQQQQQQQRKPSMSSSSSSLLLFHGDRSYDLSNLVWDKGDDENEEDNDRSEQHRSRPSTTSTSTITKMDSLSPSKLHSGTGGKAGTAEQHYHHSPPRRASSTALSLGGSSCISYPFLGKQQEEEEEDVDHPLDSLGYPKQTSKYYHHHYNSEKKKHEKEQVEDEGSLTQDMTETEFAEDECEAAALLAIFGNHHEIQQHGQPEQPQQQQPPNGDISSAALAEYEYYYSLAAAAGKAQQQQQERRSSSCFTSDSLLLQRQQQNEKEQERLQQHDHRQRRYTCPSATSAVPATAPTPAVVEIEIAPGEFRPLRGSDETSRAIALGYTQQVDCFICSIRIQCIADCEMVICPECRMVSPILLLQNEQEEQEDNHVDPILEEQRLLEQSSTRSAFTRPGREAPQPQQQSGQRVHRLSPRKRYGVGLGLRVP